MFVMYLWNYQRQQQQQQHVHKSKGLRGGDSIQSPRNGEVAWKCEPAHT